MRFCGFLRCEAHSSESSREKKNPVQGRLLDEFDSLQRRAVNLDTVYAKVSKMMPESGFAPEDADRFVALFSGGWLRISLGMLFAISRGAYAYNFKCSLISWAPKLWKPRWVFQGHSRETTLKCSLGKQQKEIESKEDLIARLGAGANPGCASTALLKRLAGWNASIRMQMKIRFPERGTSGRSVVMVKNIDLDFRDKVSWCNQSLALL
ncbi:hypothetical protein HID58_016248 [Brassica napus]|uniref:Uncharacterized protein n=1 Tax=Brassica napus TaxID=3708 RepID=A0ABQ8DME2_BRANA|nr:hypothetical protein HID58_016248 [Brassica napus]